jgi:hypothetical protein
MPAEEAWGMTKKTMLDGAGARFADVLRPRDLLRL